MKLKPVDDLRLGVVGLLGDAWSHGPLFTRLINGCDQAAWEAAGWIFTPGPPVAGATVVALACPQATEAERLAQAAGVQEVFYDPVELLPLQLDGVLVCDDDSHRHASMAAPFIEAGVPVLIDKPLGASLAEAEAILRTAEKRGCPVMAGSGLRYSSVLHPWMRQRVSALGKLWICDATCAIGRLPYYGIHAFEAAHSLMGCGLTWVQNVGDPGRHIVRAAYGDGRSIVLQCVAGIAYCLSLHLFGEHGELSVRLDEPADVERQVFHRRMLYTFCHMVRTGSMPVPFETIREITRAIFLAEESLRRDGARLTLSETPGD
ncbi:MAG: Gfo/Idh/MocA family oxidoreductase [bacterium]|nr:Gfo/Idh/MocA family oxidoreductase [bacterium]